MTNNLTKWWQIAYNRLIDCDGIKQINQDTFREKELLFAWSCLSREDLLCVIYRAL